jgi:hypothetical protein
MGLIEYRKLWSRMDESEDPLDRGALLGPTSARALSSHPHDVPDGANNALYQSCFQAGGGVNRQPVPLRRLGGPPAPSPLGRREPAGDPVVDARAGALTLAPLAVLLETCMHAALGKPHIHHTSSTTNA